METIKYYDRIHNKFIDLEVNDEVAQFLRSDNKRLKRQQKRDGQYIAISLDEQTDYNGEEALTYHEIIADENAYIEKNLEKKEFAKCIWRVVDELEDKQAKIIKGYYKYSYKNKELASYLKMSTSAFCQFKATALKLLHILLSFDPEFSNTNFYQSHYKDFADDVREDESVEFTVYDPAGANASIQDFKSNDGLDVLTISGIKSKKTYDEILLTANKPGFFSISSIVKDVTTKSFADKYYEWEGKFEGSNTDTNFVIYVKNVPDGSEYPYYVYFSTNDDVFKYEDVGGYKDIYEQTSYRIMPLVDTSEAIGEPITDSNHVVYFDNSKNPENLKKQNSSYVVNSFKWNSLRSFAKPDTWFISDFDISVDKVVTYTTSKAFGILVPTTTTFEFMEYRENGIALPVIKFKNVCSMGIEKNADTAGPQKYGDYDEKDGANCWYLTLTNFNEGGAE